MIWQTALSRQGEEVIVRLYIYTKPAKFEDAAHTGIFRVVVIKLSVHTERPDQ